MKLAHIACAAAMLAANTVHAEQLAFKFTGEVIDPGGFDVEEEAEVSAVVRYDTAHAPDLNTGPLGQPGAFEQVLSFNLTGEGSFSADIGGQPLTTATMAVSMIDSLASSSGFERLDIYGDGITLGGQAFRGAYFVINLDRFGSKDVLTAALPSSINLADFEADYPSSYGALFRGDGQDGSTLIFSLTSITPISVTTSVPEPAAMASMGLGLLGVAGLMRRCRVARASAAPTSAPAPSMSALPATAAVPHAPSDAGA